MFRNDFERDLSRGKIGEDIVKGFFSSFGREVIDVSDIEEYQKQDIDFLVGDISVEVKADDIIHQTKNLFLEYKSVYTKDTKHTKKGDETPGWILTTGADWLAYYDTYYDTLYLYKVSDIKDYLHNNKNELVIKHCDDGYKTVYGVCLNRYKVQPTVYNKISKIAQGGKIMTRLDFEMDNGSAMSNGLLLELLLQNYPDCKYHWEFDDDVATLVVENEIPKTLQKTCKKGG